MCCQLWQICAPHAKWGIMSVRRVRRGSLEEEAVKDEEIDALQVCDITSARTSPGGCGEKQSGMEIAPYLKSMETLLMPTVQESTLLELVQSVMSEAQSDEEVIATVVYLVNSGRVRLRGIFAGAKIVFPRENASVENIM